jgi:hypothetical protein
MMRLLQTPRGRAVLFALLYAGEGAPIGFIWWALPTLMRERGGEVGRITTVLAAVAAMWTLKFLWAPVVDVLRGPRWGFRSWIVSAQFLMGLTLLPLVWLDPVRDLRLMLWLLIAHALCATLQDVAIDALAIHIVPREELGRLNGFMAAGKYLGRGLFGGVALIVAATLGWQWIILSMIGCLWLILFVVRRLPEGVESARESSAVGRRIAEFLQSLGGMMRGRTFWLGIGFALLAGAGFEAVGALCGTYLPDRGLSTETTGWFRVFVVVGVMIGGASVPDSLAPGRKPAGSLTRRFPSSVQHLDLDPAKPDRAVVALEEDRAGFIDLLVQFAAGGHAAHDVVVGFQAIVHHGDCVADDGGFDGLPFVRGFGHEVVGRLEVVDGAVAGEGCFSAGGVPQDLQLMPAAKIKPAVRVLGHQVIEADGEVPKLLVRHQICAVDVSADRVFEDAILDGPAVVPLRFSQVPAGGVRAVEERLEAVIIGSCG